MYCRHCGTLNDDNAWKCVQCGDPLQHEGDIVTPAEPLPNYLVHAILVTVLCCVPFGIVAIVYAAQVNARAAAGNIQGALDASRKARTWAWASFGAGLLIVIMWFIIGFLGAMAQ
jgi:hypothetical protein